MAQQPSLAVSVLMRHERVPGAMARWQPWRWVLAGVQPAGPGGAQPADAPMCLERTDDHSLWRHMGFQVSLHRDDVEGYHLNLSTDTPCFWVMWRADPVPGTDDTVAVPQIVTLSYHDAGRWLDAQENVDRVDAPPEVLVWLRAFTDAHYQPEPKRRQRPDSFRPLSDRFGNPASVSTDKTRRGGGSPADGQAQRAKPPATP